MESMGRGQWGTEMSSTCRSVYVLTGHGSQDCHAYAFRSQCAEERPEEGVRTTNGVLFFRASSHLASTSKSVEGSSHLTSKTGVMCKPLLGKGKVWEKKNCLLTPGFTPFQNKYLRDEVWIISWMRCLSPLISEGVTRSALGQVSNYLTAMERQSQLFP